MKKLICFDLDGTLLNADKAHIAAFNKAFEKNGLRRVKDTEILPLFGLVKEEIIKRLFNGISDGKIKKIIEDKNKFLIKETYKYAKTFSGVSKSLRLLKKRYDLGIVSNCAHKEITILLKKVGIDVKLFSIIIGNDDVKIGKPAPDEIIKAEKISGLNAEYMVGDTIYDIKSGKRANVKTIGVLTGIHSRKILEKEKPWKIINGVKDLTKYI